MSHFSTIKTKIKSGEQLVEALLDLGYDPQVQENVMVVSDAEHAKGHPDVTVDIITKEGDIGFRWNETTGQYELVTDLQTWDKPVPVERFLSQLSQQYALRVVTLKAREEGYEIEEQKVNDEGTIELLVSRWS
tara:strand:- start:43 stop:441 length:399 start_codon:yes stop_codon:yes gene_type:complete